MSSGKRRTPRPAFSPAPEELNLEKALAFAQWQATVAFRVIEGDDARPVGPDEEGMKIRC